MTRAAATYDVVFWEPVKVCAHEIEPVLRTRRADRLLVATPTIPSGLDAAQSDAAQRKLLDGLLYVLGLSVTVAYYATRLAFEFASHLDVPVTVLDLGEEPLEDDAVPSRLPLLHRRLLRRADLVITNGRTGLYPKQDGRPGMTQLLSCTPPEAMRAARKTNSSPAWQNSIPRPRIGYFGPIDVRLDLDLLEAVATLRPAWHFIMLGHAGNIQPLATLPRAHNLHWRGPATTSLVASCLSGWDAGLLPLVRAATPSAFAPARALEFLTAGVPIVATPAGQADTGSARGSLVRVRREPEGIVAALEQGMAERGNNWLQRVDEKLAAMTWDVTWAVMQELIERSLKLSSPPAAPETGSLTNTGTPLIALAGERDIAHNAPYRGCQTGAAY